QTLRNHLREAHLHARRPHRGLDLTAVCRRNQLEWANAHIQWRLARWRGVLFTDESRFSLFRDVFTCCKDLYTIPGAENIPVPANIQQLRTAIEEEWTNIPQATINNLINSMRRRCVALREANGGHTRY
ncbi:hypothetical protein P3454_25845, partial [Vibrio parahaemolyticus]|nr:hypothetical protein [Vibrio parahaemolyticus]